MGKKRLLAGAAVLAALAAMGGCGWFGGPPQHRVFVHHEVGDAHMVVLSVAPWEDYAQRLQPGFTLRDGQTALEKVLPLSARLEEKILAGLSAQVTTPALPNISRTGDTTKTTGEDGKVSLIEKWTYNQTPAAQPTTADPLAGKNAASLPTPSEAGLKADPMLQHLVATALFQEVQVLNSYLRNADIGPGYKPYLVRLQVSLMPKARNQPYDAYTMLTFFQAPGHTQEAKRRLRSGSVKVLPMLVSDNLEMALAARSQEMFLKLSASLSLISQGAAGGDVAAMLDKMSSSLSQEYNSLFTVARINDNTLKVRMGAYRLGDKEYAMVPRTHHLNVLLLVPTEDITDLPYGQMEVTALTEFVDAKTGKPLEKSTPGQIWDMARAVAHKYVPETKLPCLERMVPSPAGGEDTNWLAQLVNYAQANEYRNFMARAKDLDVDPDFMHAFWLDLIKSFYFSAWDQTTFYLPCRRTQGSIWLHDDGAKIIAKGLDISRLQPEPLCEVIAHNGYQKMAAHYRLRRAVLELNTANGTLFLSANKLPEWKMEPLATTDVKPGNATCRNEPELKPTACPTPEYFKDQKLDVEFPSLKAMGLDRKDIPGQVIFAFEAQVTHILKCVAQGQKGADGKPGANLDQCRLSKTLDYDGRYSCFLPSAKEEKPPQLVKLTPSTTTVTAGKKPYELSLDVTLTKAEGVGQARLKKACRTGAEERGQAYGLVFDNARPSLKKVRQGAVACEKGAVQVEVIKGGTLDLSLDNLTADKDITITPRLDGRQVGDPLKLKVVKGEK